MANYNRFTFNVMGMIDGTEAEVLSNAIRTALASIPKTMIKTLNLDLWTDGYTGQVREFNEEGIDIATIIPETPVEDIAPTETETEIDITTK